MKRNVGNKCACGKEAVRLVYLKTKRFGLACLECEPYYDYPPEPIKVDAEALAGRFGIGNKDKDKAI